MASKLISVFFCDSKADIHLVRNKTQEDKYFCSHAKVMHIEKKKTMHRVRAGWLIKIFFNMNYSTRSQSQSAYITHEKCMFFFSQRYSICHMFPHDQTILQRILNLFQIIMRLCAPHERTKFFRINQIQIFLLLVLLLAFKNDNSKLPKARIEFSFCGIFSGGIC